MFTNTYLPHVGGVARSVANFTEDLQSLGHRLLVVAPTFPDREAGEDADAVLRVPALQNFNGSDFSVRIPLPFVINERIDEFRPHVIHSHHPFLMGDSAMRAAYRRNLPLVFTHHTLYEQYTHYVSSYSSIMKRFAVELSTLYANLCSQVVAPSTSIAELIAERGVKRPIEVIPTGVDLDFFRREGDKGFRKDFHIPAEALVIGHLGRLAPEKNLGFLAEAVASAMKTDERLWFLVVGEGPSKVDIRKTFSDAGLSERLVMAGKQTGEDLARAYHAMDLFVFSSKSETQGMVLAEAMACRLPVIALDAPGAREVVRDGENGRLLGEDAESESFSEAIVDFFSGENEETADKWRKESLETASVFSRGESAQKMSALYNRVTEADFARPPRTLPDAIIPWESLQRTLKAEWELISQKATALVKTVQIPPSDRTDE
jgi:glycosyltransferase involved in cell wall biosynthesis